MKKLKHILFLLMLTASISCFSQQRYFYYVRYNPSEGNPYRIVDEIDRVAASAPDRLVVMISGGPHPMLANLQQWQTARNSLILQQNAPELYTDVEEKMLDSVFNIELCERVIKTGDMSLQIVGENDSRWTVTFIMSQDAFKDENEFEIVPLEWSIVNQLHMREVRLRWLSYDKDGDLNEREMPKHHFYTTE